MSLLTLVRCPVSQVPARAFAFEFGNSSGAADAAGEWGGLAREGCADRVWQEPLATFESACQR